MSRLLLDTQVFFWMVRRGGPRRTTVVDALEQATQVLISDVSAFEVALKVRLGKFDEARSLAMAWHDAVSGSGGASLAMRTEHALLGGDLDWAHRDPFDRLLAAQALVEDLTLVTADPVFRGAPNLDLLPW